jgi:multicomponent Na+:H+ antiporter subunit F
LHEVVFYVAVAWMMVLLIVGVVATIRLPLTAGGRILALDTLTLILTALLVLYGTAERTSYYLDVALVLALLAFVGTLVAACYYGERKIF